VIISAGADGEVWKKLKEKKTNRAVSEGRRPHTHGRFVNQYDVYALRHNDDDQMLFIILGAAAAGLSSSYKRFPVSRFVSGFNPLG
jgi:hypothetical protein